MLLLPLHSHQSMKITTFFRLAQISLVDTLIDLLTAVCLISFNFISAVHKQKARGIFVYWISYKGFLPMASTLKRREEIKKSRVAKFFEV